MSKPRERYNSSALVGTGIRGLMSKIGDYVLQKMEELKIEELEELTERMR